jgi:portal protein
VAAKPPKRKDEEEKPPKKPPATPRDPLTLALARPPTVESAADMGTGALLDDDKAMRIAEWVYFNVEEVWSAFNLLSEAVARGFRVNAPTKKLQEDIEAWNDAVHMHDKVRMLVKNALIYGRCVMEVTPRHLKVRNPRFIKLEQDELGQLVGAWQDVEGQQRPIPLQRVRVFTLHRLFSDDLRGVSAVHPVLQTVDDMMEARKVNRAVAKRYRAPIRIIELPSDATEDEQLALRDALEETPPGMDMVLPPGAKIHVLNHGNDALEPDALMREHLTERIFLGLGVPKVALGIPDGSNKSVSEVQREMLLADKVAPYQRQVKQFVETMYGELFGRKPTVVFDPVDTRDEREIAEVSRLLVDAGVKTPRQVEEYYWKWNRE